jgi:molybdopterin/thiamine biosynthesis adenylyltransferase
MSATSISPVENSRRLALIGLGNIGSHLAPLAAAMPGVGSVTLIDPDSYEEKNLGAQAITPADVGMAKAIVQARRLQEINPRLRVTPIVERVENVPLGALRADVIAGCLDSRRARRWLNRMAWRLGVPLVDAGVRAEGMLARVQV